MGLDISFHLPGGGDTVFFLYNHGDFLDLMSTPELKPIDPNYTDFKVSQEMIDRVTDIIRADFKAAGLSWDRVPETLPDEFHDWDAREMDWEDFLPCYLRILEDLRDLVDQHGYLICGWSA